VQDFECPVAVWPVTIDTTSRQLRTFGTANKSPNWNQIRTDRVWEKQ